MGIKVTLMLSFGNGVPPSLDDIDSSMRVNAVPKLQEVCDTLFGKGKCLVSLLWVET